MWLRCTALCLTLPLAVIRIATDTLRTRIQVNSWHLSLVSAVFDLVAAGPHRALPLPAWKTGGNNTYDMIMRTGSRAHRTFYGKAFVWLERAKKREFYSWFGIYHPLPSQSLSSAILGHDWSISPTTENSAQSRARFAPGSEKRSKQDI